MRKIKKSSKASLLYQVSLVFSIMFGGYLVDTICSWPEIKRDNLIILTLSFIAIFITSTMLENILIDIKD